MSKLFTYFQNAPKLHRVAFWLCLFVSISLMVGGFLCPPRGVIDGSILTAVGELLGFATIAVGIHAIERGMDAKFTHGQTTIEINNDDTETN